MAEIRILTVRQPWAWAIIHGGKDVENRVRNIAGDYRGPVAIHSAQRWDDTVAWNSAWETVLDAMKATGADPYDGPWQNDRGLIIGVVDLVDVHFGPLAERWDAEEEHNARCSPWAEADMLHLVLANPRPLAGPVPFKGALGLRKFDSAILGES